MRIKEQKKLNENNLFLYKYITTYIKATDLILRGYAENCRSKL